MKGFQTEFTSFARGVSRSPLIAGYRRWRIRLRALGIQRDHTDLPDTRAVDDAGGRSPL